MRIKKFIVLCVVASMSMLIGCGGNYAEKTSTTNSTNNTTNESHSMDTQKKNDLFDNLEQNTIRINYWVNDQSFEVSDSKKTTEVINFLSSLNIESYSGEEKDGGQIVDFVLSDKKISLTLYKSDFIYDGSFYTIKDTNVDITSAIMNLLKN